MGAYVGDSHLFDEYTVEVKEAEKQREQAEFEKAVLIKGINRDYEREVEAILNEEKKEAPDHEKILLAKKIADVALVLDSLEKSTLIRRCITLETKVRSKEIEINRLKEID